MLNPNIILDPHKWWHFVIIIASLCFIAWISYVTMPPVGQQLIDQIERDKNASTGK